MQTIRTITSVLNSKRQNKNVPRREGFRGLRLDRDRFFTDWRAGGLTAVRFLTLVFLREGVFFFIVARPESLRPVPVSFARVGFRFVSLRGKIFIPNLLNRPSTGQN